MEELNKPPTKLMKDMTLEEVIEVGNAVREFIKKLSPDCLYVLTVGDQTQMRCTFAQGFHNSQIPSIYRFIADSQERTLAKEETTKVLH